MIEVWLGACEILTVMDKMADGRSAVEMEHSEATVGTKNEIKLLIGWTPSRWENWVGYKNKYTLIWSI